MNANDGERQWSMNNPRFRLFAWGPVNDLNPTATINSPFYIAVWIADDGAENDDNPNVDGGPVSAAWQSDGMDKNPGSGVLTLRAEAFGPGGAHRVIETTIARTDSTELERGYTGQRGQDEQNRRARKASVQNPGAALGRSTMSVGRRPREPVTNRTRRHDEDHLCTPPLPGPRLARRGAACSDCC